MRQEISRGEVEMKQKIYYTNEKFNRMDVRLGRNMLGNVVLYVENKNGNTKPILSFDTCGTISLLKFKRGENKYLGFRLDKKGNIKQ